MKLKKSNALLSLLTSLFLLLHIGYSVYAYLTFFYDPFLTKLFSVALIAAACLHAVLGMCAVFLMGDGAGLSLYPRQNRRTVVQRLSAALFFPLLILHIRTFDLLKASAGGGRWFGFALLIVAQLLFYADAIAHAAVSLSRALITLGWLSSRGTQKTLDRIVSVVGVLLFLAAAVCIVRTQLAQFAH